MMAIYVEVSTEGLYLILGILVVIAVIVIAKNSRASRRSDWSATSRSRTWTGSS